MKPENIAQDLEQSADRMVPPEKNGRQGEGGGQPTKYEKRFDKMAMQHCLLGATDEELGRLFDVSESTINNWKLEHPKFLESIKAGREDADAKVSASLYQRALGYSHPDTDIRVVEGEIVKTKIIKKFPPSEVAAIFWLKNRQKKNWRDKQEHDVEVHGNMTVETVDYSKAAAIPPPAATITEGAADADRPSDN